MYYEYYLEKLKQGKVPEFLQKYLDCPSLRRLKQIDYFCGMQYASKKVYNFTEDISRFDHSLTTALLVYNLTKDKKATIAALFHDIATPCFSHVIDYMNKDFQKQERTEEYTEQIIMTDDYVLKYLKQDNINPEEIIDFKKYPILDNDRPKLCADRLDGIILTGISWTKDIRNKEIDLILDDLIILNNENNEPEIGFKNPSIAKKVLEISNNMDKHCQSNYDNYMMLLLAKITKLAIEKGYIKYELLFYINEKEFLNLLKTKNDREINKLLYIFFNIHPANIKKIESPNIKRRILAPLTKEKRIS